MRGLAPSLLVAAALSIGHAPQSSAQVQRMAIPAGVVDLAAGAAQVVEAFCLDLTRPSPTAGTAYRNVLAGASQARVIVDGRSMPLQQALRDGIIAVQGMDVEVHMSDFMRRLSDPLTRRQFLAGRTASDRAELEEMVREWQRMSPAERTKVDAHFGNLIEGSGDHTRLQFVSKTNRPVRIVFDDVAVLGAQQEEAMRLGIPSVRATGGEEAHHLAQKAVWTYGNRERQHMLQTLGFYTGQIDGTFGDQTDLALLRFQRAEKLEETGQFDEHTERALFAAVERAPREIDARLARINQPNSSALLATVQYNAAEPARRYVVSIGSGAPIYVGNDPATLTQALSEQLGLKPGKTLYLDLSGFPEQKADALAHTIRVQQHQIDPGVEVMGLPRLEGSTFAQDVYFARGVRLERVAQPVVEEVGGGWFRTTIEFLVRIGNTVRRVSLEVYARTADVAQALVRVMSGQVTTTTFDQSLSLADLVAESRRDILRAHPNTSGKDIKIQFGSAYYVTAPLARPPSGFAAASVALSVA